MNTVRKIELEQFDNRLGLKMAMAVLRLVQERGQHIAIKVDRLTHNIFTYFDYDLPKDKHNWLDRKIALVKHFEERSLGIKHGLINGKMSLEHTFALDPKKYLAKGGAIPIFVKNVGMVAIIAVSGLQDEADHQIIIDATKDLV